MSSKYGDFYPIDRWGFVKQEAADHVPSPDQFMPEHLNDPSFYQKGYHREELGDGFHWVTSPSGYDAAFVETGEGVIVIDAPPTLGENLIAAIESVTDEPIAKVVYSHWHSDHIGAASMFGPDVEYVAHDITRELLERFPDSYRPVPTTTFRTEAELELGGVRLELSYKGADHCPGNIYIWAPAQEVLTKIDIVSPGSVTFMHADASENISGFFQAHDDILDHPFKALVGGHISRWGTRADVEAAREFWYDVLAFSRDALKELSAPEVAEGFLVGLGREQQPVGAENWMNSMANYITEKTLTKKTSDGRTWPERLAGATAWTKYHAYTVMESSRLERTHHGYQRRGTGGEWYIA